ncbi:putative Sterile alpha motif domain-containing protein [Naja naja]|nr:putative Sterile alpha motif domain-containing protein [Naja naja]
MNSARTRYVIKILPVLRGQIEVAKRVGWVLCMPSFPVASPVQRPADCNLPPTVLRPTLHRKHGLIPLRRDATPQLGLPQAGKWDLSLLEALDNAPKPPS